MRLPDAFDRFHDDLLMPDKQEAKMETAKDTLIAYLRQQYGLGADAVFPQGSYANGTAIRPADRENGEYDVDLICVCAQPGQSPDQALDELERRLRLHGTYEPRLRAGDQKPRPCVTIPYALDEVGKFHVDIVPARPSTTPDPHAPLSVPRRGEGWHDSAPLEYRLWCESKGERFKRTVRMLKRWRENNQSARTSVKSIVLQVLAASHLDQNTSDDEALVGTFRAMKKALVDQHGQTLVIPNPVMPAENLAARWTAPAYHDFLQVLDRAIKLGEQALRSHGAQEAHDLWCELLGDSFPAAPSTPAGPTQPTLPPTPAPGFHTRQAPPRERRHGR